MGQIVMTMWRNRWRRAAVLLVLLAAWVLVPHRWDGPVVWAMTETHGVHKGDLYGLFVAVLVLCLPSRVRWED